MIAAALNRFSPLGVYETRHLLNGLVGVLGLVGCWKLGRALGGPRAGFIALAVPAADAELLRPDVQQPEGHPVRGRRRLGDLLHGPHPADPAAPAAGGWWSSWGSRSGWRWGCGSAACCSCAISACCWRCSGVWQAVAARRVDGAGRRPAGPACGACSCRRPRSPIRSCWCSGRGRRPTRSTTRCARSRSSRTRPSRSTRCSTAASSRPATCRGNICRPISLLALPELVLVLLLVGAGRSRRSALCAAATAGSARPVLGLVPARLRDRLPGRLRDRDQGGAVRRHAPFHLRAAADRGRRGAGRRSRRSTGSPRFPTARPVYAALGALRRGARRRSW